MHSTIQSALSPSDKMFAGVLSILFLALLNSSSANLPVVIATWEFNKSGFPFLSGGEPENEIVVTGSNKEKVKIKGLSC